MTTRQHFENEMNDGEEGLTTPPPSKVVLPSNVAYGQPKTEALPPRRDQRTQIVEVEKIVYQDQKVNIYDIYADVTQPRRTIPAIVRQGWDGTAGTVAQMFERWLELIAVEHGKENDEGLAEAQALLNNAVAGRETNRGDQDQMQQKIGRIERALLKVADLASSIRESGLLHKIAVIKQDSGGYLIEAGERRWLAFNLLYLIYQDEKWLQIPAAIETKYDVWKQAFENNARDDLNAISRARQLAKLLMVLYPESHFKGYHECASDREYYAQVESGTAYRAPRGSGDKLLQGTGLKNAVQITYYRALLKLPDEIWIMADDLDWTENRLRPLAALSEKTPDEALRRACAFAREEGYTLTTVNVCDEFEAEATGQKKQPAVLEKIEKVALALGRVDRKEYKTMTPAQRRDFKNKLATMRSQLEEMESWD